jgi:hypothetical protein
MVIRESEKTQLKINTVPSVMEQLDSLSNALDILNKELTILKQKLNFVLTPITTNQVSCEPEDCDLKSNSNYSLFEQFISELREKVDRNLYQVDDLNTRIIFNIGESK